MVANMILAVTVRLERGLYTMQVTEYATKNLRTGRRQTDEEGKSSLNVTCTNNPREKLTPFLCG